MDEQIDDEWARELRAEREQAAAEGRPYAVPVESGLKWDFGAPMPTILQWEGEAHIFFFLRGGGDDLGSIVFDKCMASTFGPGGEEGHALGGSGWMAYTPLRVVNSRWLPMLLAETDGISHFVLSFHDSTFECLAYSFRETRVPGTRSEAIKAVMRNWD